MSEPDEAPRPDPEEFHPVPQQQEEQQVERLVPAVLDEGDAHGGGEEVDAAEQHRWDTPFEASAGADLVEQDVRGHAAAQEDAGADAGVPQTLHEIHDGLTFHTGALRCGWSCVVSAPRLLGAVCSARRQASRVVCPAISQSTLLGWSAEERWSSACGLEWRSVRRRSPAQPFAHGRFRARCRR